MQLRALVSVFAASLAVSAVACGASDRAPNAGAPSPSGSTPSNTTPSETPDDPNAAIDPVNDPPPSALPELVAFDKAAGADVAADLSCLGKPLQIARGMPTDREFHAIELGGADGDRVGDVQVELFLGNKLGTPDSKTVAAKADDMAQKGVFMAKAPPGFVAYRVPASPGFVSFVGLDLEVPESGPVLTGIPTEAKVSALSVLISGGGFTATAGAGRAIVRVVDCASRPLAGVHLTVEVDGTVPALGTANSAGILRSYFGDAEFPSAANKWSSRSGVVAFIELPGASKSLRVVARAKVAGAVQVVGMRAFPLVADGLTAAKVLPYTTP